MHLKVSVTKLDENHCKKLINACMTRHHCYTTLLTVSHWLKNRYMRHQLKTIYSTRRLTLEMFTKRRMKALVELSATPLQL